MLRSPAGMERPSVNVSTRIQTIAQRMTPHGRFLLGVFAICVGIKLAVLMLDSTVRLFIGDSGTYLVSAVFHGVPHDRSYTYPLLIWLVAGTTKSLYALLALQTLIGAATATVVCFILNKLFDVRRGLALTAALVVTLDPSQLFYERMVMTESASTFMLVAALAAALWYVRTGTLRYVLICIFLGLGLASLRTALVPIALALGVLSVLVRLANATPRRIVLRHLIIAIVATVALHGIFQIAYGIGTRGDPAYIRDSGLFQLGLVAPLVAPEDFNGTGVNPKLLEKVQIPLSDPRMREAQLWAPHGLIEVVKSNSAEQANRVAATLAHNAIRRDPFGLIRFGWLTTLDYFDANERRSRLWSDLGSEQSADAGLLELVRTRFHYDATGIAKAPSPIYDYFSTTAISLVVDFFALVPLSLAVIVLCWRNRREEGLLLGLLGIGLVSAQFLFSHIISFRYLHPFPVLVALGVAVIVDRIVVKRGGQNKRPAEAGL
jgi:4-amino-4-deoxy-L-arabinose transferase-like glycosyltransferase